MYNFQKTSHQDFTGNKPTLVQYVAPNSKPLLNFTSHFLNHIYITCLVLYLLLTYLPWWQASWDQHGAHLGPTGPRWAPCWPHASCYLGNSFSHPATQTDGTHHIPGTWALNRSKFYSFSQYTNSFPRPLHTLSSLWNRTLNFVGLNHTTLQIMLLWIWYHNGNKYKLNTRQFGTCQMDYGLWETAFHRAQMQNDPLSSITYMSLM